MLQSSVDSSVVLRSSGSTGAQLAFGNATFAGLFVREAGTYTLRVYLEGYAEVRVWRGAVWECGTCNPVCACPGAAWHATHDTYGGKLPFSPEILLLRLGRAWCALVCMCPRLHPRVRARCRCAALCAAVS